jgi:hypothetical protein
LPISATSDMVHVREQGRPAATRTRVIDVSLTQEVRETCARSAQVVPEIRNRRLAHFTKFGFEALSRLIGKLLDV